MSHINWDKPFFFDPATGQSALSRNPGRGSVSDLRQLRRRRLPVRRLQGVLLTKADGTPYSYDRAAAPREAIAGSRRQQDYLFYRHDVASAETVSYSDAQAEADAALLNGLVKLNTDYDPEASLYAGATEFAMIGELGIHEKLSLLSPVASPRRVERRRAQSPIRARSSAARRTCLRAERHLPSDRPIPMTSVSISRSRRIPTRRSSSKCP
jgi:hypothetical protein